MSKQWERAYRNELLNLNLLLVQSKKSNPNQHTIFAHQFITNFNQQLDRIIYKYQYPFTFQYLTPHQMEEGPMVKCARRLIKMRFRCKNSICPESQPRISKDQRSSEIQRNWTSYNGLTEFRFRLQNIEEPSGFKQHVKYTFFIYRQKCMTCKEWGKSGLIESLSEQLIDLYSLFIQNSFLMQEKNKQPRWSEIEQTGNIPQHALNINSSHMRQLCEGCMLQVCINDEKFKLKIEECIKQNEEDAEAEERRSIQKKLEYVQKTSVMIQYKLQQEQFEPLRFINCK